MNLVTGATGHIGNVLVRQLLEQGEKVRALILRGEDLTPLKGLNVETVVGDVLDPESLKTALEGVQRVFHLAGIISIMPGPNELVRRVNVDGTLNIIYAAIQAGVRRLVYTSSIHAIVRAPDGIKIDESLPFDPHNPVGEYDRSKAEATLAVQEAVNHGLDAVIVCPTGVIGPYDYRTSEMGSLIRDCSEQKPQMYIDGAYDFVDVRDVAEGIILAGEKGHTGEYYILSGERISVRYLLETIREITGKGFFTLKVPFSLGRFLARYTPVYYRLTHAKPRFTPYSLVTLRSNSIISHAKADKDLGYQPRPLRQALTDTIQWFREHRSNSSAAAGS
jgi:dihydroflavonol-4-reductase